MGHRILCASCDREDDRGRLVELAAEGPWAAILYGTMRSGALIGNHYHGHTRVLFGLTSGKAEIRTIHVQTRERDRFFLEPDQAVILLPRESHAIVFCEDSAFVMAKSERFDSANPDTFVFPVPE